MQKPEAYFEEYPDGIIMILKRDPGRARDTFITVATRIHFLFTLVI